MASCYKTSDGKKYVNRTKQFNRQTSIIVRIAESVQKIVTKFLHLLTVEIALYIIIVRKIFVWYYLGKKDNIGQRQKLN